jgi:hypothetical protein
MTLEFPPKDCDGNPLSCGDGVHFVLVGDGKLTLMMGQIVEIAQTDSGWQVTVVNPYGERMNILGTEHLRRIHGPIPQLQEGVDLTKENPYADL